jgi:hypothetical protein
MQGYSKGSLGPYITVQCNGYLEASEQGMQARQVGKARQVKSRKTMQARQGM